MGDGQQKIKYSYGLVPAPLALALFASVYFRSRVKNRLRGKKAEGSGNGPGGRRARETHKQAESIRNKGTQGGGGNMH